MYDEWLYNYVAFRSYILSTIGEKPAKNYTLDRIDNDTTQGYFPGNLRWATRKTQALNRRPRTHSKITREQADEIRTKYANGQKVVDIAKEYNLYHKYIYSIINYNVWRKN